jgi:hypothetical protein
MGYRSVNRKKSGDPYEIMITKEKASFEKIL